MPAWLTAKLLAGIGGALLILAVLGWCHHAGKVAQKKHDAPIIAKWKGASAAWETASNEWMGAYNRLDASLGRLREAQAAKTDAADKAVQHAAKRRPHVEARVKVLSEAIHPELNGVTLEAWNKADGEVVEALR